MTNFQRGPIHTMDIPSPHDPNMNIVMRLQERWDDTTQWVNAQAHNPHTDEWYDFDFTMDEVNQIMEGNHAPIDHKFDEHYKAAQDRE